MTLLPYDLDVDLASRVQELLFPKGSPVCDWCCIGVKYRMARGLGGDYFDFIALPDGCQFVMIGDVTGHGLHASVVMSLLYGFVYRASLNRCDPLKVAKDVNAFLENFAVRSQDLDHFFSTTLFCGVIDPATLAMRYVNAGQPLPLVRRQDQVFELKPTSPPLGFFREPEILMKTFQLQVGDRLLLYTDGIVETVGGRGELFGIERLKKVLLGGDEGHIAFLDRLFTEVERFERQGAQKDDCTAIAIDFHRPWKKVGEGAGEPG